MVEEKKGFDGDIVLTSYQSKGKGQRGQFWESEDGKNLLLSIILKPKELKAKNGFFLNTISSISLLNTLQDDFDMQNSFIKWPNDIYANNKKIAGILVENNIRDTYVDYSIVGVGFNVNQTQFKFGNTATSLSLVKGRALELFDVLERLISNFERLYLQLCNNQKENLKAQYLNSLYGYKKSIKLLEKESNHEFLGEITGLDEYGRALVNKEGETRAYDIKEIVFQDFQ